MNQERIKAPQKRSTEERKKLKDLSKTIPPVEDVLGDIENALRQAEEIEKAARTRWTYNLRTKEPKDDCIC